MILKKYLKLPLDRVVTQLYRQGSNPDFDFPPTAAKLLDMLTLGLTAQEVTLDTNLYAQACGYTSQAALQKQIRKDLQALNAISLPAGERGERYQLLTNIQNTGETLTAIFSEPVAYRLTRCPRIDFPAALLAVDARKQNTYFLGRRLAEFGSSAHTVPVGVLLEACPYIPPADGVEWSRSVLKRKAADIFASSMDALQAADIITWQYRTCDTSSYPAFKESLVQFEMTNCPPRRDSATKHTPIHINMTPYLKEGETLTRTLIF